jgi:hypothetical protein
MSPAARLAAPCVEVDMNHWVACGLLALALGSALPACSRSCEHGDRVYEDGNSWTCSDGCNYCSCDNGAVTSTAIACPKPPGPNANKLDCAGPEGGTVRHGDFWNCGEDMCCRCDDGDVKRHDGECPVL